MDELINRITTATGLNAGVVETAVGAILAFLAKEGPSEEIDKLFAAIPGSQQAVANSGESGASGGLMGMLGGGGGVMALGQKLMAAGVPMSQMQSLGRELFAHGREKAGEDTMGTIMGAIPGLGQFV